MKATRGDAEHTLAVFIDFENLALGFNNRRDRFRIEKVLERLVEKGKIVVKKAYCDWSRFGSYTGPLHESAIELIEIPKRHATGKNSADIRLVVDAVDLAYSKEHIDTFVIVSGDSDFSPLVSKLKELGKHVIGLGLQDATSELLRDNCDEFIYYEDLGRAPVVPIEVNDDIPENKQKVFALLMESLLALRRENKDTIFSSMVKDTMKRKKPSFNEEYHGYRTFSDLLEDAEKNKLIHLERHKTSGTYIVSRFGEEDGPPDENGGREGDRERARRRRRRRGSGSGGRDRDAAPVEVAETPVREAAPAREPAPPRQAPPARPEPRPQQPVQPPQRTFLPPPPPTVPAGRTPKPAPKPLDVRDEIPLGRALIDDVDILDDELPSYRPAKPAPAAPKPAAKVAESKPAAAKAAEPAKKPAPVKKAEPAKKPAKPAAEKPPAKAAKPADAPARKKAEPVAKKPAPKPADDDSFGAGLDL